MTKTDQSPLGVWTHIVLLLYIYIYIDICGCYVYIYNYIGISVYMYVCMSMYVCIDIVAGGSTGRLAFFFVLGGGWGLGGWVVGA